MEMQTFIKSSE